MSNPNPETTGRDNAPRCSRLRQRDKQPCKAFAVRGTEPPACRKHAGRAVAAIRSEVQLRQDVLHWGLGDKTVDPGELLLRLVSQAARRAQAYALELSEIVEQSDGDLRKALTGDSYTMTAEGDSVKTGEYIKAITRLESEERDRAGTFAVRAVAAGLAERQVRLAEDQGALIAEVIRRVLADLNLPADLRPKVDGLVARHLRAVS